MANHRWSVGVGVGCLLVALAGHASLLAEAKESPRLERAKDLIADEQWARAVDELKAAAADPKETNKDEALFWLAHSEHQAGDDAGAIQTVARLERQFPASRWVRPARSLQIEIAQTMRRDDVLWAIVAPAPPSRPATPSSPGMVPAAAPPAPAHPAAAPTPPPSGAVPPPPPAPARDRSSSLRVQDSSPSWRCRAPRADATAP